MRTVTVLTNCTVSSAMVRNPSETIRQARIATIKSTTGVEGTSVEILICLYFFDFEMFSLLQLEVLQYIAINAKFNQ